MTIVIWDGKTLAADRRRTQSGEEDELINKYTSVNKIFDLRKDKFNKRLSIEEDESNCNEYRFICIGYSGIDPYYLPVTEETFGPGYEHVSDYEELTKALATFRLYIESKKNFEVIIPHLIFGAQIE